MRGQRWARLARPGARGLPGTVRRERGRRERLGGRLRHRCAVRGQRRAAQWQPAELRPEGGHGQGLQLPDRGARHEEPQALVRAGRLHGLRLRMVLALERPVHQHHDHQLRRGLLGPRGLHPGRGLPEPHHMRALPLHPGRPAARGHGLLPRCAGRARPARGRQLVMRRVWRLVGLWRGQHPYPDAHVRMPSRGIRMRGRHAGDLGIRGLHSAGGRAARGGHLPVERAGGLQYGGIRQPSDGQCLRDGLGHRWRQRHRREPRHG